MAAVKKGTATLDMRYRDEEELRDAHCSGERDRHNSEDRDRHSSNDRDRHNSGERNRLSSGDRDRHSSGESLDSMMSVSPYESIQLEQPRKTDEEEEEEESDADEEGETAPPRYEQV